MTARFGGAYGRGYSSSGESVVELPSEGRTRAQKERIRDMARKNATEKADVFSATPGARAPGVEVVEQPLNVGPRDALIDDGKGENDYIPDVESKGSHVRLVRQPAKRAADARGTVVGFVSEHPSKFAEQPQITDLKAYHNAVESSDEWEDAGPAVLPTATEEEARSVKMAGATKAASKAKAAPEHSVGDELDEAAAKGAGDKE
jgi:hypothetical protein